MGSFRDQLKLGSQALLILIWRFETQNVRYDFEEIVNK